MFKSIVVFIVLLPSLCLADAPGILRQFDWRVWQTKDGKYETVARFISTDVKGLRVILEKPEGDLKRVDILLLCETDREMIKVAARQHEECMALAGVLQSGWDKLAYSEKFRAVGGFVQLFTSDNDPVDRTHRTWDLITIIDGRPNTQDPVIETLVEAQYKNDLRRAYHSRMLAHREPWATCRSRSTLALFDGGGSNK